MLVRTSILERVSGPLADRLSGCSGSERILSGAGGRRRVRGLAGRGAVIVSLPPPVRGPARARAATDRPPGPRRACTRSRPNGWPNTGIRSRRFATRRRPRTGHWPRDCWRTAGSGCTSTVGSPPRASCCPDFPPTGWQRIRAGGARRGRQAGRGRYGRPALSGVGGRGSASVPEDRRGHFQVSLVHVRLGLAPARNDLTPSQKQRDELLELADSPGAIEAGVGGGTCRRRR